MNWLKVEIETDSSSVDAASGILCLNDIDEIQIIDKKEIKEFLLNECAHYDYIDDELSLDETGGKAFIIAFLTDGNESLRLIDRLKKDFKKVGLPCVINVLKVGDEDIAVDYKSFFKPNRISENITVVPTWIEDYAAGSDEIIINIDPGLAFGTGEHETTSMCVGLINGLDMKDKSVIDIGCGSGILSIAAVKLGAKRAYLVDIDEFAVKTAQENVILNKVANSCAVSKGDLLSGTFESKADYVFANITADVLIRLAGSLRNFLNEKGKAILSGIIHSRLNDVLRAFISTGFRLEKHIEKGEWNALLLSAEK